MKRETNKKRQERRNWSARLGSLLVASAFALNALAAGANGNITIQKNNISVKDAFAAIKQQAKVYVMYETILR